MNSVRHIATLAALSLASCATTTKLDTARPVDVSKGFIHRFKQDDKHVSDLAERLKEHPAAGPKLGGYDAKAWGAAGLLVAGSTLVLVNTVKVAKDAGKTTTTETNPLKENALGLVGVGLALASLPLSIMANRQMSEAVEAYNTGFAPKPAPQGMSEAPTPFVAAIEDAAHRRQCVAGISGRF